jgi:5'-3' exoribonuclease 2
MPQFVSGVRVDPDTSSPNPNGVEYDNLYLDMNGIIHPACHPEDLPAPVTEEEMYLAIFKYIDRVFNVIRPRKLLFMAVDGVAPRAKMNQQRSRRYRTAKEIEDKRAEEERLRNQWASSGKTLPPKKPPTWDHNVITPGTAFMHRLTGFLRYYIHNRITNDPGWRNVKVVLSAADVPGEGEHKVMEYIRLQRAQKGYNPNTRHCIHGKDADLIMLALATHEPHFSILRELDLNPHNRGMSAEQLKQKQEQDINMIKLGEADEKGPAISCPPFKLIQMNIVREYLDKEFRSVPFCFPYDQEAVIDDFVLFCFFAGNDFLPHLPSLDIHEGAIGEMIRIYKESVSSGRITGWLSSRGNCNLERCGVILQEFGKLEDDIFRRRKEKEEGMAAARARRERETKSREASRDEVARGFAAIRERLPDSQPSASAPESKPANPQEANKSAAKALKDQLLGDGPAKKKKKKSKEGDVKQEEDYFGDETPMISAEDEEKNKKAAQEFVESLKAIMDEKNKVDQPDDVKLFESGWKERYYKSKFDVDIKTEEGAKLPRKVVQSFMEGICWTLLYYYRGCPSWIWYYPYHYAPFASDFVGLAELEISFPADTEPFQPFQQLMACLPPLSRHALPEHYQKLMVDPKSPIIDFYPKNFKVDMNGKKMAWLGVAILPFIDENRLLQALGKLEETLKEEERLQNMLGTHQLFVGGEDRHKHLVSIVSSMSGHFKLEASSRTEAADGTFINDGLMGVVQPWHKGHKVGTVIPAPSKRLPEVHNKCICMQYTLPPLVEHVPKLLPNVVLDDPVLTEMDTIVEGRKLLDGPPGGRGRGRGPAYHDGSRPSHMQAAHMQQYGNAMQAQNPMARMIAAGLAGPPMGGGRPEPPRQNGFGAPRQQAYGMGQAQVGGYGGLAQGGGGGGYNGYRPPEPAFRAGATGGGYDDRGGGYGGAYGSGGGGSDRGGYGVDMGNVGGYRGGGYGGGGYGGGGVPTAPAPGMPPMGRGVSLLDQFGGGSPVQPRGSAGMSLLDRFGGGGYGQGGAGGYQGGAPGGGYQGGAPAGGYTGGYGQPQGGYPSQSGNNPYAPLGRRY